MKILFLIIIVNIISFFRIYSSDNFSVLTDTINSRIDQSGISRKFFNQRFDSTQRDFSLSVFNSANVNPFIIMNAAEELDSVLFNFTDKPEYLFRFYQNLFGMKKHIEYKFSSDLPRNYLKEKLGVSFEDKAGFIGSKLLTQYISVFILAMNAIEEDSLTNNVALLNFLSSNQQFLHDIFVKKNIFLSDEEKERNSKLIEKLYSSAKLLKKSDIFSIAESFFKALLKLNMSSEDNIAIFRDSIKSAVFDTKIGRIAIGGSGDDEYKGNFAFIIDIGGNDIYIDNQSDLNSALSSPVRCIIDFEGNDIYSGRNFSIGGTAFGISIIIDKSGNDSYHAEDHSIASAMFGVGMLIDRGGNDFYNASSFSLGFGFCGMGLLFDKSGSDIYRGSAFSMAASVTGGIGILADNYGDDRYIAENLKSSVYAASTPSFTLASSAGTDINNPGGFSCFTDYSGNDKYDLRDHSAGTSVNNSAAIFKDKAGTDLYSANMNSFAFSSNNSMSLFADNSGDDIYLAETNCFGKAGLNSTALFLENSGDDLYHTSAKFSDKPQLNSFSVFIDNTGKDFYDLRARQHYTFSLPVRPEFSFLDFIIDNDTKEDNNNINNINTSYPGLFQFPEKIKINKNNQSGINTVEEMINSSLSNYYNISDRNEFYSLLNGNVPGSLKFIRNNINSDDPEINEIVTFLFYNLLSSGNDNAKNLLSVSLKSGKENSSEVLLKAAAASGFNITLMEFERYFYSIDNNIKAMAVKELAYFKFPFLYKDLNKLINDKNFKIRLNSIFTYSYAFRDSTRLIGNLLKNTNSHESLIVLYGLLKSPSFILKDAIEIIESVNNEKLKRKFYILLSYINDFNKHQRKVRSYIASKQPEERKFLYDSLIESKTKTSGEILNYMRRKETNKKIKEYINLLK